MCQVTTHATTVSERLFAAERLLGAARRLFAQRGFSGVSVEDLVTTAAVTRPVLYYHFQSKEGLSVAACRDAAADYEAAFGRAASASGSVVQRIVAVCETHIRAMNESNLPAVAFDPGLDFYGGSPASPRKDARLSRVVGVLPGLILEGIGTREICDCNPDGAAIALAGAATAAFWALPMEAGWSEPQSIAPVLAPILQGLRPVEAA